MSTRAALGIWTLALACAAGAAVMVETSDHTSGKLGTLILAIPTALAFIAGGILARVQRPENRTGTLLILVGFAWTLGALTTSDNDVVFTIGLLVGTLFTALLAHLLLAFPTGRLETRADRWIAYAFYAVAIVGPPLAFMFDEGDLAKNPCAGDSPCPDNLIAAFPNQTVANTILIAYALASTGLAGAVLVRLVQRWRRASPALRRALFPVFVTAAVLIALAVIQTVIGLLISERVGELMNWFVLAAVLAVPISFLYGLTRTRFGTTTRRLVGELSQKRDPAEVQDVLRAALRDPTLELGYLGPMGYVDVHGRPLKLPEDGGERMTTRVGDEVLVHDAALADQPELAAVVDATHIALERGLSLRSLEASERRATALLDAIPDSMYRVSRDGTFLEFRLSETARLPVPADQLVGMTIADVIGPEAVVEVSAAMARALDQGTTELVEYTLDQPELRDVEPFRHIEARIVRSGPDEVVAIVRDITERKRQQEALEALAAEQAALRRVAVAVATASRPDVLFNVVTEEVARRLGADAANLIRFERNEPEGVVVGTWSNAEAEIAPIGTRFQLNGGPVTRVRETARPARGHIDDPDIVPSPIVDTLREQGVRWMVSAPIVVSGELWGAVVVTTTGDRTFPHDAEERIGQFAGLVATALANAEAREQLSDLADEQAAVSRVALAIATQSTPETTFYIVTEELGRVLDADAAILVRFVPDSIEAEIVGKWSEPGVAVGDPGRTILMDGGPLTRVHRTGKPSRGEIDDAEIGPRLRDRLSELGASSMIAAPVEVSGELWGSIVVCVTDEKDFPEGAEDRIEKFAALVSVALANAEAREQLSGLADEQAAVSRVALAIATQSTPETTFDVVTEELGRLLGADAANLVRFEPDSIEGTIVGKWSEPGVAIGMTGGTVVMDGGPVTRVHRTGAPARGTPDDPDIGEPLRERLRKLGVTSVVAVPVNVGGEPWGSLVVALTGDTTFPEGVENRIAQFAGLVGVALANAQARGEIETLAREQAAVSRVAVAAATQPPENLFDVVTEETAKLFGAKRGSMVRYVEDDEVEVVGIWQDEDEGEQERGVGGRFPLLGGAVTQVKQTGRPSRLDRDYDQDGTPRQMVAAPIIVAGELWGAASISSPLPHRFERGVEQRLEAFTGLVAVALANAQAHRSLATLAEEQSALSRVAVEVATEEQPERLFDIVSEEVGRLLDARSAATVRYVEGEDASVIVGGWTADEEFGVDVGAYLPFQGGAIERVARTGKPARVDIEQQRSTVQDTMRSTDVASHIAAPIVVSGRLWGATSVSIGPPERFPSGSEGRLGKFTGLVALALANAQAREELAGLAKEQAALSRVAVAAATERPERLFDIVSEEVGRLFGAAIASTSRYAEDGSHVVIVGRWGEGHPFEIGRRVNLEGGALTRVRETGRPARQDATAESESVRESMRQDGVWSSVAAPIVVSGRLWGGTVISLLEPDVFPEGAEERLGKFTSLVAVALANAQAREELTASRARIVQAGDAARRRFERNLHDGAQQRLVTLSLSLRLAQAKLDDDSAAARELLEASSAELASALEELRELARGLHPAVLTDRGLEAALEALADRAPVPVVLDHVTGGRLPPPVEAAAYYVVAESLTNVAKYADASSARVRVEQQDGHAIVEVEDDGVGGVDITRGSGLRGLADRVEALDGRLIVSSEAGQGTRIRAEIPCSRQS